jgi:hypothetical protein
LETYAYDTSNKRIAKQKTDGTQEFYFCGVDGKKFGTYIVTNSTSGNPGMLVLGATSTNVYIGAKLITTKTPSIGLTSGRKTKTG